MPYREIVAVCAEIHTKHINALCEQNVEFVNVKPGGTYSDHLVLEGYFSHLPALRNTKAVLTLTNDQSFCSLVVFFCVLFFFVCIFIIYFVWEIFCLWRRGLGNETQQSPLLVCSLYVPQEDRSAIAFYVERPKE